ncbi:MAG TPA: hypothetical protein VGV92_05085 [Gammaproteobacteria bacterium]|nr:hypothetical protein [Gammaproteobacteria bacterium]
MKHDKLAAPKGVAEKVEGKAPVSDKEMNDLLSMLRSVDHDHGHGHHDASHHNSKVSHGRRR